MDICQSEQCQINLSAPTPQISSAGTKRYLPSTLQAAVDHMLRFRYIAVAAHGQTNGGRAFQKGLGLRQWLAELDRKYNICAHTAYPLSNKIRIPFKGAQAIAVYNSSYKLYLSQLQIRVKLAFGRMTTKFQLLRTKMSCKVVTQSKAIQAVARLAQFHHRQRKRSIRCDTIEPRWHC
jgi:hypothetical protein